MDPISSLNQIALVLRQQLLEKAKSRGAAARSGRTDQASNQASGEAGPDALSAMQTLLGASAENELQALRRVIQLTLREQFGPEFENDAGFQRIVETVTATIHEEPGFMGALRGDFVSKNRADF